MKFLSRMIAVIALLGVLAYGSYAFGMYVLSAKLFGDGTNSKALRNVSRSTTEASAVTRQTGWKGSKPRVEVKVLPADETGGGAPVPAYADEDGFQKQAPREERRDSSSDSDSDSSSDNAPPARLGKREFDSSGVEYSPDDEDRPRKRSTHRRRKRHSKREETKPAPKPDDAQARSTPAPDAEERSGDDNQSSRDNSRSQGSSDSGSDRAVINNKSSDEREAAPRETPRPRETTRRRSTSTRPKPRATSPVPRPEGSRSGGDSATISPVPQPE
jgi:hypothetical protein